MTTITASICVAWALASLTLTAPAQTPAANLTIAELRALPEEAARGGMPVTVRGVLTYYEPGHRMAFLQDATGAIYLHVTGDQGVVAGDEVEVRGFLDPGYNGRNIRGKDFETSPVLRRIGSGALPQPVELRDLSKVADAPGACWTVIEARVAELAIEGDRARLSLVDNTTLPVYLPGLSRQNLLPGHLRGLRVRLHGILADSPVSANPLVMRRLLLVPGVEQIVVLPEDRAKRFEARLEAISTLQWIPEREGLDTQVRVCGIVTWLMPHEGFFMQAGSNATWVHCTEPVLPALRQAVVCAGRPASYHGVGVLRDAMWLPDPNPAPAVEPIILGAADPKALAMHGRFTRMRASLVEVLRGPKENLWILKEGGTVVFAHLAGTTDGVDSSLLERAAVLSLDGILLNRPSPILDFKTSEGAVHLFLRDSRDLRLLSPAPFWTLRRLATLLSTIACIAILAAAWVIVLRRKIKRQSEMIHATASREAVDAERLRIAREWHDSFEQHFAGLTMLMDAAATMIPGDLPASGMLERAARMADHSRAEARQAIWDLRDPRHSADQPFAVELQESLRQSWSEDAACRLHFTSGEAQAILPRFVALQLIRIANVAVTNAFKHADCKQIAVSWNDDGDAWSLSIRDDGKGLPATTVEQASSEGHFGLLGMRERALRLNASLQIISPPSQETSGTLVRLSLPKSVCNP